MSHLSKICIAANHHQPLLGPVSATCQKGSGQDDPHCATLPGSLEVKRAHVFQD